MHIIIVEDELKTAQSLERAILSLQPASTIAGRYQSVESTVKALTQGPMPDLIFMDIQLADGRAFDIFSQVKITCPVVFCTAYDAFTLDAFKSNGVDYILKPFSKEDIAEALRKVNELKNFFQQKSTPDLSGLLAKLVPPPAAKTTFLVFQHQKYRTVHVDEIALFFVQHEATWMLCFDKQRYPVNQSLDQIAQAVSPKQFFRLNRQHLVNFSAIREVEPYFLRKLLVKLSVETPEKLTVNKEKSHQFLAWMEER